MNLFDALILNEDRKESDQLITPEDWRLHLLDHSRAFQVGSEALPPPSSLSPASLSRSLLQRLIELEAESLSELFEGLLTDAQIEALLGAPRQDPGEDQFGSTEVRRCKGVPGLVGISDLRTRPGEGPREPRVEPPVRQAA